MSSLVLFSGVGVGKSNNTEFLKNTKVYKRFVTYLDDNASSLYKEYLLSIINQLALYELWINWGLKPGVVLGHSLGELPAAYVAGMINEEGLISILKYLCEVTSKTPGHMMHGFNLILTDGVYVASNNFVVPERGLHQTFGITHENEDAFLNANPHAKRLYVDHLWHYPKAVITNGNIPVSETSNLPFISSILGKEVTKLDTDYWNIWLTNPAKMITASNYVKSNFVINNIVEIGANSVMREMTLGISSNYFISSDRLIGTKQVFYQQVSKLFSVEIIKKIAESVVNKSLNCDEPLIVQGFSSFTLTELSSLFQFLFPGLKPQDLYYYQSLNNLFNTYGRDVSLELHTKQRNNLEDEIVIIGSSCLMPGGINDLDSLHKILLNGQNTIGNEDSGYIVPNDLSFDYTYFGMSKQESSAVDPQQLIALNLVRELFDDVGITKETLTNLKTGVYVGCWNVCESNSTSIYSTLRNSSIISARISSTYNLRGPSKVMNTACASSLEAIMDGFKDLKSGRVEFAVCGGVNFLTDYDFTRKMREAGFLGASCRCKTFDNEADGYVRSEGGGFIMLTTKSNAKKMNLDYYCAIAGGSTNHNGFSPLLTVPSSTAQEVLIRESLADANLQTHEIDYLECHGTGTKIGDPLEVSALTRVFSHPMYIGSIKANVGHLESGAGIVGLIKSILVLNKQVIFPCVFDKLNTNLDMQTLIANKMPIIDKDIRNIGVSSFGFGGSNAHIILSLSQGKKQVRNKTIFRKGDLQIQRENTNKTKINNSSIVSIATDIGITDFDTPLLELGLDSLAIAELVAALNNVSQNEFKPGDLFANNYSFSQILELSNNKQHPVISSSKESVSINIDHIAIDMGIEEFDVPLVETGLDSLAIAELVAMINRMSSSEISAADLIGKQYSFNDLKQFVNKKQVVNIQPTVKSKVVIGKTEVFDNYHYTKVVEERKIVTTHVGSLPRFSQDAKTIFHKQRDIGIDICNDGEYERQSYAAEILNSMTGFTTDTTCDGPLPQDLIDYPENSRRFISKTGLITLNPQIITKNPICNDEIKYVDDKLYERIDKFIKAAKHNGLKPNDCFYSVPSPGTLFTFFDNHYYKSDDEYLCALSKALSVEYEAIVSKGLLLQVDCPDLAMGKHTKYKGISNRKFVSHIKMHAYWLNEALRNIPKHMIRMHVCWGNYSNSHHRDIGIDLIIPVINSIKHKYLLIEGANPIHNSDVQHYSKLNNDITVVLGCIDSCNNRVESSQTIANNLIRLASVIGRERIMAGSDCGFSTTAESSSLTEATVWLKLKALVRGAELASHSLFGNDIKYKRPKTRVYDFTCSLQFTHGIEIRQVQENYDPEQLANHMKAYVDVPIWFKHHNTKPDFQFQHLLALLEGTAAYPTQITTDDYICTDYAPNFELLKYPTKEIVELTHDVIVVGAGLTGLYVANKLKSDGYKVIVLEKNDSLGGIWNTYANDKSQVNSSEGAYRLFKQKQKTNKDHTTTREIIDDIVQISKGLDIYTGHQVKWIEKTANGYTVTTNGKQLVCKGCVVAINDRVGFPKNVIWKNQEKFKGQIKNGFGNDTHSVDWNDKVVIVVGMGAFAIENVRTALENGAKKVIVVAKRHGTVCPKYIDYINFVNKRDNINHNSVENTKNMILWWSLYDNSGATMPECWMKDIKHYGHTISVSDIWWIAHYLGVMETIATDIKEFSEDGIITMDGEHIDADIIVRCTGFERNASLVPTITNYKNTNSINYLDENLMYLADALIDDNVFNSMFGSSVLEMAKFYTNVFTYFLKNPDVYKNNVDLFHNVPIVERKWSDYIKGLDVLCQKIPTINKLAIEQANNRHNDFIESHDVETYLRENKREWRELNRILSHYSHNNSTLAYPEW
jgi:3-oxoacyl-(acyl-carrier-protein) synthase/methionine synthase II (cobalamin-independent)/thioredoxin reductase/acyl carrier protein